MPICPALKNCFPAKICLPMYFFKAFFCFCFWFFMWLIFPQKESWKLIYFHRLEVLHYLNRITNVLTLQQELFLKGLIIVRFYCKQAFISLTKGRNYCTLSGVFSQPSFFSVTTIRDLFTIYALYHKIHHYNCQSHLRFWKKVKEIDVWDLWIRSEVILTCDWLNVGCLTKTDDQWFLEGTHSGLRWC